MNDASTSGEISGRVEALERRIAILEYELAVLRYEAAQAAPPAAPAAPPPRPAPTPAPAPRAEPTGSGGGWGTVFEPAPAAPPPLRAPPKPAKPRRELDLSRLLGALGLAWAGGIVTVLGIVFLFVLAANRGWIGPELRIGLGATVSVGVFAAGFWLRRRFGTTYAALAAAGAGIAGAYATLLAAVALYEFVPELLGLVAAGGIAAAATAVALAWEEELVAALGLVGAILVPLMTVVEDGELTTVGTAFAVVVLAGTAVVALREHWRWLLLAGLVASYPQVAGLVGQTASTDWAVVAVAAVFTAVLVAVAAAIQLGLGPEARLDPLAGSVVLAGAALACAAGAVLFSGEIGRVSREGLALLVVAAAYLTLGAVFLRRLRDFSSLLWAVGLAVAAVAGAELLSGTWLAAVWAAEAAVLAWLAERTGERRLDLSAAAYLGLALAYTLGHDAPVRDLFELTGRPADGVPSVLAVAAAAAAFAWFARAPFEPPAGEGPVSAWLSGLVADLRSARAGFVWLAGIALAYAASLTVLGAAVWGADEPQAAFERGQVAVTGLWAAIALGLVVAGGRLRRVDLAVGGLVFAGIAALKAAAYDDSELGPTQAGVAFCLAGAGALLSGFEYQRGFADRWVGLRIEAALAVGAGAIFAAWAAVVLGEGTWERIDVVGGNLVLAALPFAALAAAVFRDSRLRDLATLLWAIALVFAGAALLLLLGGPWVVLAWSAAAAALAGLSLALRELRFQIAAGAYLVAALAWTLVFEAPPSDFFVAAEHPGAGVPSLLAVVAAAAVFGLCVREPRARAVALAGAGVLALYALSLTVLEAAELVSTASVETDFQRGHTAVSAVWGLVGLGLLTLGLLRRMRALRLAGFALFGISLVKLFLYDLAYLSPFARALSFLAVGALLLLGGFFYQRLSDRLVESP